MDLSALLIFAGALLIAAGAPGPSVAALVARVIARGWRDVAPFVGVSDIVMTPSITDMAGLNNISRVVLANAAAAIVAMAARPAEAQDGKPAVGLTMFGVTTPCVTQIVERLKSDYDCLVFHATGTGGRTMEKLADSGLLAGVLDITTTEVCDFLFGGVLPATEDRGPHERRPTGAAGHLATTHGVGEVAGWPPWSACWIASSWAWSSSFCCWMESMPNSVK